jgi:RHS repeat-associated protein
VIGYSASYDAAGNMTCRAPTTASTCSGTVTGAQLSYSNEGELAAWQNQPTSPSSTTAYLYDGQGERVAQQVTQRGSTTTTVYVGDVEEVSTTGSTTQTTTYYYANGKRIALGVNGQISYLASDALGSSTVAFGSSGTATASQLFAPYGTSRYSNGIMPTSFGFTGQRGDAVSGLNYFHARYLDPLLGQFTSADTVLPGGGFDILGLSRYAYVEGNPIGRTDPSGHEACIDDGMGNCVFPDPTGGGGGGDSTGGGGGDGTGGGDGGGGCDVLPDCLPDGGGGGGTGGGDSTGGGGSSDGTGGDPWASAPTDADRRAAFNTPLCRVETCIPTDWWNIPNNARESAEEILQQFQQLNDDLNSNDLGRQASAALSLLILAATIRAGRGEVEAPKPVNLPAWRRVDVDMDHIASGHMEGGLRVSVSKDVFPSYMSRGDVESAVRNSYRYSARIRGQGDTVLVVGPGPLGSSYRIEMWVNTKTRIIESAYPVYR